MGAGRTIEHEPSGFMRFLMSELNTQRLSDIAKKAKRSHAVIDKYSNNGLDDIKKRIALVKACGIDMQKYQEWQFGEVSRRWDE